MAGETTSDAALIAAAIAGDAEPFCRLRLACSPDGHPTGVTTYAIVPDTAAGRAQFSLAVAHPGAAIEQDPSGIPGTAGNDLADVTAPGIVDVTAGKPYLQETTEDAMRQAQALEVPLNGHLEACFVAHGSYRVQDSPGGEYSFHDPTGTIGAICQHFGDSGSAVRATPAGAELIAREIAQAKDVNACIDARHPTAAERAAVSQDCENRHRDAFLAGLPTFH
jgi:hypothetical protein